MRIRRLTCPIQLIWRDYAHAHFGLPAFCSVCHPDMMHFHQKEDRKLRFLAWALTQISHTYGHFGVSTPNGHTQNLCRYVEAYQPTTNCETDKSGSPRLGTLQGFKTSPSPNSPLQSEEYAKAAWSEWTLRRDLSHSRGDRFTDCSSRNIWEKLRR